VQGSPDGAIATLHLGQALAGGLPGAWAPRGSARAAALPVRNRRSAFRGDAGSFSCPLVCARAGRVAGGWIGDLAAVQDPGQAVVDD